MNDKEMQKSETKKFDQNAYINAYKKEKYKEMKVQGKPEQIDTITNFCKDLQISRQKFMINCALYIIKHDMLDEITQED